MSSLSIFGTKSSPFGSYKSEPLLRVNVEWLTQILEVPRKGKENRTAKLTEPRFSIEGTDFILTDDSYLTLSQAFINNNGQGDGFFFKCPLDYYVKATPEYYDTEVYQLGILHNLTGNTYQICKQYSVAGVNSYKTILGVISDTLKVYKDGVLVTTGYTLNAGLGTVTFEGAQTGALTVECKYELKFRFDVTDIQLKQIKRAIAEYGGDKNVYQSINFRLVEDDYSKVSPLESSDWSSAIGYDFGDYKLPPTTYSERVLSRIEKGDNLKESREVFSPVRRQFRHESCNKNWRDLQRIYTLFNVAKGRLLPFGFEGIDVRFDSDSFGCEQLGVNAWAIDEMGSIETLFSVGDEVKNWAYFVKIGAACTPKTIGFADSLNSGFNYNLESLIYNGGPLCEIDYAWNSTGGFDGGGWVEMRVTYQNITLSPESGAFSYWINPSLVYVPTNSEEIVNLTFSAYVKNILDTSIAQINTFRLALKQSGNLYFSPVEIGGNPSSSINSWTLKTSSSFSLESTGASLIIGSPIQFGIFWYNAKLPDPDVDQRVLGIDNLSVSVNVGCP